MMINDLGTRALVIIEPATAANKAVWRRVGLWSRLTWVIRVVWGIVVVVAVLLLGEEVGTPNANGPGDAVRPSQRLGTCRCGLAVGASSGWIRDIQVDFTNRLASRWQGPGAIIPGVAWIGDQRLHWVPGGRPWGGRAFEAASGGHRADLGRSPIGRAGRHDDRPRRSLAVAPQERCRDTPHETEEAGSARWSRRLRLGSTT